MVRSTSVENVLQIGLFLQNKANFRKSQMDVTLNITRDYEKKSNWTFGENKPNQSQFWPITPSSVRHGEAGREQNIFCFDKGPEYDIIIMRTAIKRSSELYFLIIPKLL